MAFLEQRLSTRITRGALVKITNPGRIKIYTDSGELTQKFTRAAPVHEMDLSHGVLSAAAFQIVLDLWYVVHFTPYTGFRARMQNDYIATLSNSYASFIVGSTTDLQLQRAHRVGAIMMLRNIYKPVSPTVVVHRTRAGSTSPIAATVDYTTGRAVITGHAGGDTYPWTGEFDLPMTFAGNEWTGSLEVSTENLHVSSDPIKLEELLLP